jgi:release factor glutamine methyltransferase
MGIGGVDAALGRARALGIERLDAQLLLGHVLARSRAWVLAHGEVDLAVAEGERFDALCRRRAAGEPLAYLIGEKEFHGLRLAVDRRVLVPRPETELLVEWALELLAARTPGAVVADLGTGSGAIALAVGAERRDARICAVDLSPEALAVAQGNAERLGIAVEWLQGDWWEAVADRRFDVALANPPYVDGIDPHLDALRHEPLLALSPGADGMSALRTIALGAAGHLNPEGWLLLEHGHAQGAAVRELLRAAGFDSVSTRADMAGLARCSGGRLEHGGVTKLAGAVASL